MGGGLGHTPVSSSCQRLVYSRHSVSATKAATISGLSGDSQPRGRAGVHVGIRWQWARPRSAGGSAPHPREAAVGAVRAGHVPAAVGSPLPALGGQMKANQGAEQSGSPGVTGPCRARLCPRQAAPGAPCLPPPQLPRLLEPWTVGGPGRGVRTLRRDACTELGVAGAAWPTPTTGHSQVPPFPAPGGGRGPCPAELWREPPASDSHGAWGGGAGPPVAGRVCGPHTAHGAPR